MKKAILFITAIMTAGTTALFAQASDCPENVTPCKEKVCSEPAKTTVKKADGKKIKADKKVPRRFKKTKMSPEAKAEFELFMKTVKEYKEKQTPENKAKLTELLGKQFDKRIEMNQKRAESMKKAAADLEKKTAELKANRDKEIEKMFERITSPKKTFRKRAPKTVKPAVKAPAAQPAAPQAPAAK